MRFTLSVLLSSFMDTYSRHIWKEEIPIPISIALGIGMIICFAQDMKELYAKN